MKDLLPLAEKIAVELIARKQTIGVAESSTGGLISAALLAVPGASAYFIGGGVIYTRDARRALMDIPDDAFRVPASRDVLAIDAGGLPALSGAEMEPST